MTLSAGTAPRMQDRLGGSSGMKGTGGGAAPEPLARFVTDAHPRDPTARAGLLPRSRRAGFPPPGTCPSGADETRRVLAWQPARPRCSVRARRVVGLRVRATLGKHVAAHPMHAGPSQGRWTPCHLIPCMTLHLRPPRKTPPPHSSPNIGERLRRTNLPMCYPRMNASACGILNNNNPG